MAAATSSEPTSGACEALRSPQLLHQARQRLDIVVLSVYVDQLPAARRASRERDGAPRQRQCVGNRPQRRARRSAPFGWLGHADHQDAVVLAAHRSARGAGANVDLKSHRDSLVETGRTACISRCCAASAWTLTEPPAPGRAPVPVERVLSWGRVTRSSRSPHRERRCRSRSHPSCQRGSPHPRGAGAQSLRCL